MTDYFERFKEIDHVKRRAEAARQHEAHPDRCCVLVAPGEGAPSIDKHKYIVPKDMTVGGLVHVLRKRMEIRPEEALFLMSGSTLPMASQKMGDLHYSNRESDGFLYLRYTKESTFGYLEGSCFRVLKMLGIV